MACTCARRLVAALDETIKLPLDAEWDGMSAEFAEYCLRISVRRNPDVAALRAELRTLLPEEEASALLDKSDSAEQLAGLLAHAAAAQRADQSKAPVQRPPPAAASAAVSDGEAHTSAADADPPALDKLSVE